jgi:hypothetical protein
MSPSEHGLRYSGRPNELDGRKSDGRRPYGQTALLHRHQIGRAINKFREAIRVLTVGAKRADHDLGDAKAQRGHARERQYELVSKWPPFRHGRIAARGRSSHIARAKRTAICSNRLVRDVHRAASGLSGIALSRSGQLSVVDENR